MLLIKNFKAKITDIGPVQKNIQLTKKYRFIFLKVKSEDIKRDDDEFRIQIYEKKLYLIEDLTIGETDEIQAGLNGKIQHKGDQEPFYKLLLIIQDIRKINGNKI